MANGRDLHTNALHRDTRYMMCCAIQIGPRFSYFSIRSDVDWLSLPREIAVPKKRGSIDVQIERRRDM